MKGRGVVKGRISEWTVAASGDPRDNGGSDVLGTEGKECVNPSGTPCHPPRQRGQGLDKADWETGFVLSVGSPGLLTFISGGNAPSTKQTPSKAGRELLTLHRPHGQLGAKRDFFHYQVQEHLENTELPGCFFYFKYFF